MSLVLNVEILGEYKKLSQATKGAETTISKLGTKFASIGKNIAKVTAGIGLGLGAAVASQIKPAIDAASDLSESINAVNVAFGDSAEGVLKLGENAARGLGLSKNELFGISVQFSSFAKTIAGEGGNVVSVVDDISKRGADFASVFNLEVSDALGKFQSGLAGSSEPLRAYGIDVSAATVTAYALANGIGDGSGQLTEQEKVLARYGTIMEQTDQVTGDFVNTSDGLANQQRITKATIEDLRAEIGEKFLPILNGLMTFVLEDLLPAFEDFWNLLTDPQTELNQAVTTLNTNLGFLFGKMQGGTTDTNGFATALINVSNFISSVSWEVLKLTILFDALGKSWGYWVSGQWGKAISFNPATYIRDQTAAAQAELSRQQQLNNSLSDVYGGGGESQRFANMTVNVNINRAQVDAQGIVDDINRTFKQQGLAPIGIGQGF